MQWVQGVVCPCERFEGDKPAGNIISLMTKCQISPTGVPHRLPRQEEAEEMTPLLGNKPAFFLVLSSRVAFTFFTLKHSLTSATVHMRVPQFF